MASPEAFWRGWILSAVIYLLGFALTGGYLADSDPVDAILGALLWPLVVPAMIGYKIKKRFS